VCHVVDAWVKGGEGIQGAGRQGMKGGSVLNNWNDWQLLDTEQLKGFSFVRMLLLQDDIVHGTC
jgi:hypothetical protein